MIEYAEKKEEPILIYSGGLVHNYIGKGPFMFPII